MGAAKSLVTEITRYLGQLNEQQQKAVLGVVKTFAKEKTWWNNKSYIKAMDKRFEELESGKVKGVSLDELEAGARQSYITLRRRKLWVTCCSFVLIISITITFQNPRRNISAYSFGNVLSSMAFAAFSIS